MAGAIPSSDTDPDLRASYMNAVNAAWGLAAQARRRARKEGIDSKRFATSMRRAMPRNSSLIFQTAVGILAFILAL
jgi:hypothetical protein